MNPASLGVTAPECRIGPSETVVSDDLARALVKRANASKLGGRRFEVVGSLPDPKPTPKAADESDSTTEDMPEPKRKPRSRAVRSSQES